MNKNKTVQMEIRLSQSSTAQYYSIVFFLFINFAPRGVSRIVTLRIAAIHHIRITIISILYQYDVIPIGTRRRD